MRKRDIIVIGASAGGFEAIQNLVRNLRADLEAAIFVVLHTHPHSPSMLADTIRRVSRMPVEAAEDQKPIRRNCIYTAVPDRHLIIDQDHLYTRAGPKENRTRPAIDPLFRSAAVSHASCVIGIVLTGLLDDGTSGLMAIKKCGGLAIVQDPRDAAYPEMCISAMQHVEVDHCMAVPAIPDLLHEAVQPCTSKNMKIPPELIEEVRFSFGGVDEMAQKGRSGRLVALTCPECGGPMWETEEKSFPRFRCYTGHNYTSKSLLADIDEETEKSLYVSLQLLKERGRMLDRMADDHKLMNRVRSEELYRKTASETKEHANRLSDLLLSLKSSQATI